MVCIVSLYSLGELKTINVSQASSNTPVLLSQLRNARITGSYPQALLHVSVLNMRNLLVSLLIGKVSLFLYVAQDSLKLAMFLPQHL